MSRSEGVSWHPRQGNQRDTGLAQELVCVENKNCSGDSGKRRGGILRKGWVMEHMAGLSGCWIFRAVGSFRRMLRMYPF